ncbi:MAG TPA: glycosyltransferase family 2 protein [Candidatus Dormibacteraeota bacterium]
MFSGCRVGVVVPAHNEETQIDCVIETMPSFVDRIFVVDDGSVDSTADHVNEWVKKRHSRVELIRHEKRRGVGAAISSGYMAALAQDMEVVAVMAGDGQMDPQELHLMVGPVAEGKVAYAKGNRLTSGVAWQKTPKVRYLGNAFLSLLTKISSGYWHVADTQSGYTAITADALRSLDLESMYPSYGYPNDMLIRLNIRSLRVADVHIPPRYGIGERSKMKVSRVIPTVTLLLIRGFFYRMFEKYVIRDFHPLVFFYALGALLTTIGFVLGLIELWAKITQDNVAIATIVLVALLLISGLQLLLFAMWFDMEYNKDLK